ncbi:MAG: NACHT domain-containing protein, partial [Waterburya sp.]
MSLTYQGVPAEDLLPQFRSTDDRYQNLWNAYIERMLRLKGSSLKYPKDKVKHWLSWLAKRMVQESRTVFLIEKMQPTWLENQNEKINYQIGNFLLGGLIVGLFVGLIIGLIKWLIFGLSVGLFVLLIIGLGGGGGIAGLIIGLLGGLIAGLSKEITLFEQMIWSWRRAKSRIIRDMTLGIIGGMIGGLIFRLNNWLITGLFIGLIFGLNSGLSSTEFKQRTFVNQGILNSSKNSIVVGLIGGVIFGLIGGLFDWVNGGLSGGLLEGLGGLIAGLIAGLVFWLNNGGFTCIQHFNLRRILYRKDRIPWNYASFLDYASELLLMKKVGGGY